MSEKCRPQNQNQSYWVWIYGGTVVGLRLDGTGVGSWDFEKFAEQIAIMLVLEVGVRPLHIPSAEELST
jgi:hypothetical protein